MEKFIIANWKMNKGSALDLPFLTSLSKIPIPSSLTVIIAPPYTLIQAAQQVLDPTPFYLGAQDCSSQQSGPYTGDISASMLRECGCTAVILGHSERRQEHQETSAIIQKKAEAAAENGLLPIICVGETAEEHATGQTAAVLERQIKESTPRKDFPFCIAYEPIWAIGTGQTPPLEEISRLHTIIKQYFRTPKPVLYGGSVTPDNTKEVLSLSMVDGLLVGGASLDLEKFKTILEEAS
ncbi:MAG: triose-phosphate isomerase [Alphaproteobacteria bacterium RIFCSPLOWO2_01_FULL_45_8]|nr:MAG: triose-phosphate isomerase [Alphaproteobacteria bacterium GWB1_45_5]OFW76531.1 MAG: triose-phosphate isomerase [Alphaproteobacteria bacterium GWA1_45_9]OFW90295.1 MAG: triose-phosphate isomerase [Alphaproteobacteria bacterium RIFCSPHIGHO2_01_FULL_41_14]OFW96549.1 MAG: triose-phosphate isomerase [Alphaproteobacteria bacterium RIFCSPLOWO2_01_FULL_45_8]